MVLHDPRLFCYYGYMNKKYLAVFVVFGFLVAGAAFAHDIDLGVPDPGVLPTSPFYFVKEWRRGITRLFTFNPIKKAELELTILNEKAAEAQEVEETSDRKSTRLNSSHSSISYAVF